MSLLVAVWISDVFFLQLPSRHGSTAEQFVWKGTFLPHPFRDNETIQMFWKQVRKRESVGQARGQACSCH